MKTVWVVCDDGVEPRAFTLRKDALEYAKSVSWRDAQYGPKPFKVPLDEPFVKRDQGWCIGSWFDGDRIRYSDSDYPAYKRTLDNGWTDHWYEGASVWTHSLRSLRDAKDKARVMLKSLWRWKIPSSRNWRVEYACCRFGVTMENDVKDNATTLSEYAFVVQVGDDKMVAIARKPNGDYETLAGKPGRMASVGRREFLLRLRDALNKAVPDPEVLPEPPEPYTGREES